jgi:RNA polymerase sigma factor (TIGR02999 family)
MAAETGPDATVILTRARQGHAEASSELFALIYDELRRVAARYLESERADHTLQPTALVHEAYVRLVDETRVEWRDRTHFFRTAAQTMRRILVDHARGRRRAKRGGDYHRVTLDVNAAPTPDRKLDVLELDELLTQLAALNERHAQVVQLRFFGGLTIQEVADVLGVSTTTIEDDWAMARAWLRRHLSANRA